MAKPPADSLAGGATGRFGCLVGPGEWAASPVLRWENEPPAAKSASAWSGFGAAPVRRPSPERLAGGCRFLLATGAGGLVCGQALMPALPTRRKPARCKSGLSGGRGRRRAGVFRRAGRPWLMGQVVIRFVCGRYRHAEQFIDFTAGQGFAGQQGFGQ